MNDFGLNTHHETLHVKNSVFLFFAACTKITVTATSYLFKFLTVTKLFFAQ